MILSRCAIRARALIRKQSQFQLPVEQRFCRYSSAPATVVDVGFWKSLVPKAWRGERQNDELRPKSKGWNPATYFIIMFLFIGSMSIQMIVLHKQSEQDARRSAVKIALLREIVEKIRKGEKVDVEKALGTGDAEREANWEEVLRQIERDETRRKPPKPSEAGEKAYEQGAAPETQPVRKRTAGIDGFF
ncbi:hypothetical protein XA68_18382 [Ophiocordyceps unilateralis]|uniref:Uncharacterized protein n=1 Tax=Ophiocordyceps unilateralis TaxID=268505 RepID=A0A2A9PJE4_OPHUN|nr:hypothetical protein XA68_18382 [Ophiocordyceps unilateralis]